MRGYVGLELAYFGESGKVALHFHYYRIHLFECSAAWHRGVYVQRRFSSLSSVGAFGHFVGEQSESASQGLVGYRLYFLLVVLRAKRGVVFFRPKTFAFYLFRQFEYRQTEGQYHQYHCRYPEAVDKTHLGREKTVEVRDAPFPAKGRIDDERRQVFFYGQTQFFFVENAQFVHQGGHEEQRREKRYGEIYDYYHREIL